jgi:transposase InsO family protein
MNIHEHARMTFHGRLLLVIRVRAQGWPVGHAAAAAGISVRTAYKWLARHRAGGAAALHDRKATPARCPHRLPDDRVDQILSLRRQRWSGPRIARTLRLPVSTVGLILRRHGLGRLGQLNPTPPPVRYQRQRPGELIHIDTKKLARIGSIGHRITGDRRRRARNAGWEHLHVAIDDAVRLAYTELLPDDRADSCAGFLARAAAWLQGRGVAIERVMTDNAFAYTKSKAFQDTLAGLGARHLTTRPYTPRTNGKAERFIQTCLREWLYARAYRSSADRAHDMPAWLHHYNHHRSHAGIHASTPVDRLNNRLGNDN